MPPEQAPSAAARQVDVILSAIAARMWGPSRKLIAIAGPPAAGKSTLARQLVDRLCANQGARSAAVLPMDGYHLDNAILRTQGELDRKGAPWTFEPLHLLRDLQSLQRDAEDVSIPHFERERDRVVAHAQILGPSCRRIVVEGNYLLLNTPPWSALFALFDLTVFVSKPRTVLARRLTNRWCQLGLSDADAHRKIHTNDLPNADTVIAHSSPADLAFS